MASGPLRAAGGLAAGQTGGCEACDIRKDPRTPCGGRRGEEAAEGGFKPLRTEPTHPPEAFAPENPLRRPQEITEEAARPQPGRVGAREEAVSEAWGGACRGVVGRRGQRGAGPRGGGESGLVLSLPGCLGVGRTSHATRLLQSPRLDPLESLRPPGQPGCFLPTSG